MNALPNEHATELTNPPRNSLTARCTVADDGATLGDYLRAYGYLIEQTGGYRWLAGILSRSQLAYARSVIEARAQDAMGAPGLAA